jgi:hypothetical protein
MSFQHSSLPKKQVDSASLLSLLINRGCDEGERKLKEKKENV